MKVDSDSPALPFISDAEWKKMTEAEKFARHVLEVAEASKFFDARQAAGMSIFEAAENLPVPRMNRLGAPTRRVESRQEHSTP